jgi:hypothetical protein
MNPLLPEGGRENDVLGAPQRLLYNRPSDTLVVIVARALDEGLTVQRLYHRHVAESSYQPVGVRDQLECQKDAHCCDDTPLLIFNEMRFREPRPRPAYLQEILKGKPAPPQGWGADWIGVRRFNLATEEDKRIVDKETLNPPAPYTSGWVSQIMSVFADGSGVVCKVGLSWGGRMDYFVYELSFTEGLKRKIAELPRVFL